MNQFGESVPHTGGVFTIRKSGAGYSLRFVHANPHAAALVELIAADGVVVDAVDISGMGLGPPLPPGVHVMLPTDSEAMWGRQCPDCGGYFRASHVFGSFCPYCDCHREWIEFITPAQKRFIRLQHDAILGVLAGPDGETSFDFDREIREPSGPEAWTYPEERQQTRMRCANSPCKHVADVLGEYIRCPACGKRSIRAVISSRMETIRSDFEKDEEEIPAEARERRERQWRHYIVATIAEFEAFGNELRKALLAIPCTPARRNALERLAFQNPVKAASSLSEWLAIEGCKQLSNDDQNFLTRMFNRRHLFSHKGGTVDQEYLDNTGDLSVRLHELVKVRSQEVRRLVMLVSRLVNNLLEGLESIR